MILTCINCDTKFERLDLNDVAFANLREVRCPNCRFLYSVGQSAYMPLTNAMNREIKEATRKSGCSATETVLRALKVYNALLDSKIMDKVRIKESKDEEQENGDTSVDDVAADTGGNSVSG